MEDLLMEDRNGGMEVDVAKEKTEVKVAVVEDPTRIRPEGWGRGGPVFGLVVETHKEHKMFVGPEVQRIAEALFDGDGDVDMKVRGGGGGGDGDGNGVVEKPLMEGLADYESAEGLPRYRCVDSLFSLKRFYECLNDRGIRERDLATTTRDLFRSYGVSLSATQWLHKRTAAAAAAAAVAGEIPIDLEALANESVTCYDLFLNPEVATRTLRTSTAHPHSPLTANELKLERTLKWFGEWVASLGKPLPPVHESTEAGVEFVEDKAVTLGLPSDSSEYAWGISGPKFGYKYHSLEKKVTVHLDDALVDQLENGSSIKVSKNAPAPYLPIMTGIATVNLNKLLKVVDATRNSETNPGSLPKKFEVELKLNNAMLRWACKPLPLFNAVVDPAEPHVALSPMYLPFDPVQFLPEEYQEEEQPKRKGRPPKNPQPAPRRRGKRKIFRTPPLLEQGWFESYEKHAAIIRPPPPRPEGPVEFCPIFSTLYEVSVKICAEFANPAYAATLAMMMCEARKRGSLSGVCRVLRYMAKEIRTEMEEMKEKEEEEEREREREKVREEEKAKVAAERARVRVEKNLEKEKEKEREKEKEKVAVEKGVTGSGRRTTRTSMETMEGMKSYKEVEEDDGEDELMEEEEEEEEEAMEEVSKEEPATETMEVDESATEVEAVSTKLGKTQKSVSPHLNGSTPKPDSVPTTSPTDVKRGRVANPGKKSTLSREQRALRRGGTEGSLGVPDGEKPGGVADKKEERVKTRMSTGALPKRETRRRESERMKTRRSLGGEEEEGEEEESPPPGYGGRSEEGGSAAKRKRRIVNDDED